MMVSSARPMTVLPLSLNSIGRAATSSLLIAVMVSPLRQFVREVLHYTHHGVRRRLPQAANGCVHHGRGKFPEQRLIPLLAFHQLRRLGGAYPAGRALAAGFVGEEFHHIARGHLGAVL